MEKEHNTHEEEKNMEEEHEAFSSADMTTESDMSDTYPAQTTVTANGVMISVSIILGSLIIAGTIALSGAAPPQVGASANGDKAPAPTQDPAAAVLEITENDYVLGDKNAPVAIIEYGDYQCGYCGRLFSDAMVQIKDQYVATGKAKLVYRDFVIFGDDSQNAAEAAECAGEQGKFWGYHNELYSDQGDFTAEKLEAIASKLSLDMNDFRTCMSEGRYEDKVVADTADARTLGLTGTPSTFIQGTKVVGAVPFAQFQQLIDSALAEAN